MKIFVDFKIIIWEKLKIIIENIEEVDKIVSFYFDEFVSIISVRNFVWRFKLVKNNEEVLSSDILGFLFF